MSLKEIFCQDKAIGILQRAFACGRMPHAYIFSGLEGVGKFKTACELSKLLLCKEPVKEKTGSGEFADSCGRCESCRTFEAGSHPDFNLIYKELLEFTRDNKGKKTPVDLPKDVVREFLIDKVSMRPTLSKSKVFVVSEAERLNAFSQNSLLKVLEEPPEYCFVILLCTRLEKLLPTTKSRCQIIRFAPIDEGIIIGKLRETGIGQKQAQYFGRLAQGSLGQGCRWANLELADANLYQTKKDLVASVATFEYAKSLELAQRFLDEGKSIAAASAKLEAATSKTDINRRASKTLIRIVISALQDAMKLGLEADKNIINFDQKEKITKLAGRFSAEQIAGKISNCYEALRWIDASVNEKLIFERLLLNLAVSDTMKV
jgi:DNA polymerase-3 subunit delta'